MSNLFTYKNTIGLESLTHDLVDTEEEKRLIIEARNRIKKNLKRKRNDNNHNNNNNNNNNNHHPTRSKNNNNNNAVGGLPPKKKKIVEIEDEEDVELAALDMLDTPKVSTNAIPVIPDEEEDERSSYVAFTQSLQALRSVQQRVSLGLNHTQSKATMVPLNISTCDDPSNVRLRIESDGQQQQKFKLKFTVKRDGPFSELLNILSQATGTPLDMICLKYDGITVEPSKTPRQCYMENDDLLVFTKVDPNKKSGSFKEDTKVAVSLDLDDDVEEMRNSAVEQPNVLSSTKAIADSALIEEELEQQLEKKLKENEEKKKQREENSIKINVRTAGGAEFKFRMQKTDVFAKVMQAVAQKQNVLEKYVVLKFEGDTIKPKHTPENFDMEDGDLIDAHISK